MAHPDSIADGNSAIRIGAVSVHAVTRTELLDLFQRAIAKRTSDYVCFCEAHLCVCAARDIRVRRVLQKATLVLPDGIATTWGARLLGQRFPERLSGPSVMLEVCRDGIGKGYKHFFYGGAEGVADQLADRLGRRFPGLQIVGTYTPPFRPLSTEEDDAVVEKINAAGPDIVWVGLGAPKQEIWASEHVDKLAAPLILPVGAAFDFHSGNRRWAPQWVRRIGLEWVYRMITGGRRVFLRNATNESIFTALILRQAMSRFWGRHAEKVAPRL